MQSDVALRCPACGADNGAAARFCNQCSAPLVAGPAPPVAGAERKQVTVLFSDLTGFTALTERLDPEETREIMARIFGSAAEIVGRYEGRIEKFVGDAIMAIFGVPVAHEDDPVRAVRAALELHEAVARLSPEVEGRAGVPIALHSGVNTGVVVTGELHFDRGTAGPLGDTINLAARLMNAAPSGEVWVGGETRHLIDVAFELDDLGTREFKGKSQPVAVARVRGARAHDAAGRQFRGAFVGRQAELGALLGATENMRDGEAQAIGICGDAGTGKTRLVSEFRAQLATDLQWMEGRAYPYAQHIPYAPLIDMLSHVWNIAETDSPAQVRAKLTAGISDALGSTTDDALSLYLHLYHLDQDEGVVIEREAFQERLLAAIRRILAALARRAPTVVCLQDLHWADASTATLLRGLVEDPGGPILLLGNYRPGYTPPPGMQVIELRELSPRQTAELLASLLQGEPPAALARFVAERSDGNPFYVEEVVNSLVETQVLVRSPQGWALPRPLAEAGVPATIRGVIAARIDRLDETRRRVLRHAAVVGREFLYSVVALVTDDAVAVGPSLTQLQAADLIRARRPEPDLEYIFKHALTQDVAYDGLLKAERQVLHARTARAMEAVLADRIPEFVETLAYHFQRGAVAGKAIHYLVEAGKKCVARYALVEAESHFRAAYALIGDSERTPEQSRTLAELLCAWSHVHYYEGTIGEWRRLLEKHLVDAERCDDPALLAMYLGWLGNVRGFHGDMRGSLDVLDRALELGRSVNAREAVAYVTAWRTFPLLERERVAEAIGLAESLDQTEDERRNAPYPHFKSRLGLSLALLTSGDMLRAREVAEGMIEFGRASGSARAETLGHYALAMHWVVALDFERAAAAGEAGIASAKDPLLRAVNAVTRAIALMGDMRAGPALELCNEWLPYLEQNECYWFAQPARQVRAAAELAHGRLSDGWRNFLAGNRDLHARGLEANAALSDGFVLLTYVSIARLDVKPALAALLGNPWFVFTQAPFAARRARSMIERFRAELPAKNMSGMLGLVDLCDGRLLVSRGRKAQARECLDRIRQRLRDAGLEHVPAPVAALTAEIEGAGK